MMDIPTRPGCVRAVVQKGARVGWSEIVRNLIGYWAHYSPRPVGLVLPSRDEGRKVTKSEILPLFRRTPVLRSLVGNERDLLRETVDLVNGFHLGLLWSGSAASTAGKLYQVGLIDEADKTEEWAGDEPDLVGRIESRISTFGDERLLLIGSTPTTVAGTIAQEIATCSFVLHFDVPCPHCGRYQRLVWPQFKWAKLADVQRCLELARTAAADGRLSYDDAGHVERFSDSDHLSARIAFLVDVSERMAAARSKSQMADVLSFGREHLVWYQCSHCPGRIYEQDKTAVIRRGRWSTEEGFVVDYWGRRHEDAETVERWPNETRIGFQIAQWYSLQIHWGNIVARFLLAEGHHGRSVNWRNEVAGEPFEFQISRLPAGIFADKCAQAAAAGRSEGVVPAWAWTLLATIDTQVNDFYCVVRAWGSRMRSQRIWHGQLADFEQIDRLLYQQRWPVEGNIHPPMGISFAMIDSGGTADTWSNETRTQQVYSFVLPRQAVIRAIKGSSRPLPGIVDRMRDPTGAGAAGRTNRAAPAGLLGLLVDKRRCNDLLADLIVRGYVRTPAADQPGEQLKNQIDGGEEAWLLNDRNDEIYNQHMAALHKVPEGLKKTIEVWKRVHAGARIDYRDCEAYQIAAAHFAHVDMLPADDETVMAMKRDIFAQAQPGPQGRDRTGGIVMPDGRPYLVTER